MLWGHIPPLGGDDAKNKYLSPDDQTELQSIAKTYGSGITAILGGSDGAIREFAPGKESGHGIELRPRGCLKMK